MFEVRSANKNDFERICLFYYSMIDDMQNNEYKPGWKKGIYPTTELLHDSINCGELFIGELDGDIASAMVVNHQFNEGYHKMEWSIEADPLEISVIHALGVHPDFTGNGYAKEMVKKALSLAIENKQKAVRLDVLEGNIPAEKLYTSLGFNYIDTIQMYYEDTGWTDFKLYEYIVLH